MSTYRYQSASLSVTDSLSTTHDYLIESGTCVFDESWSPFYQANLVVTLPITGGYIEETSPGTPAVYGVSPTPDRTNLIANPSFATAITGWTSSPGTSAYNSGAGFDGSPGFMRITTTTGYSYTNLATAIAVTAGSTYTISGYFRVSDFTGMGSDWPEISVWTLAGTNAGTEVASATTFTASAGTWYRVSTSFTVPSGVTSVYLQVYAGNSITTGTVDVDGLLLEAGNTTQGWFDGATTDTANLTAGTGYQYDWTGTANASTSTRKPVVVTTPAVPPTYETIAAGVDTAALDALDPRTGNKGLLTATLYLYDEATGFLSEQTSITSTLRINSRTIDWKAGTVNLLLTTDEFELQKQANMTTSPTNYRAHQSSLVAVVNQVLSDAGLTATLDPSSVDADVTTTTSITNVFIDPLTETAANFTSSTTAGSPTITVGTGSSPSGRVVTSKMTTAATSSQGIYLLGTATTSGLSVNPGDVLYVSLSAYTDTTRTFRVYIQKFNSAGTALGLTVVTAANALTGGSYTALSGSVTIPAGTTSVSIMIEQPTATSNTATAQLSVGALLGVVNNPTGAFETDGVTPLAFFSGATTANTYYTYAWDGTANASTSHRSPTPAFQATPDSLTLSPGQSYFDMLNPVVQAAGLVLFQDDLGVWRMVNGSEYLLPQSVTVQPTQATQMQDTIDLTNADNVANSVVVKYTWVNASGNTETYYDAAGTSGPTRLIELDNTPYPGPGRAAYALSVSQGRGRSLSTTALSVFSARPYMPATLIAPYTQTQTGVVSRVSFDLKQSEMSITTRGLIDTPAGAWILAPDGHTWSAGNATTTWNTLDNDFSNL